MGFTDEFVLNKDGLVALILFGATVELLTLNHRDIVISNATEHLRIGLPGNENGANHWFKADVGFNGELFLGEITVDTNDRGETYKGILILKEYPTT
jgi:hypothetical protein